MVAEVKVRITFDTKEIDALNSELVLRGAEPMEGEKLLNSLVVRPSKDGDQLEIEPFFIRMPQEWSLAGGPYMLRDGEIVERKLIRELRDEEGGDNE